MKYTILILVFYIFSTTSSTGQEIIKTDSTHSFKLLKRSILPATLITGGIFLSNSQFEKDLQKDIRNGVGNNFNCSIDEFAQYVPIAEMYIADAMGIKSRNHWFDQTKNLFISNLSSAIIIRLLKNSIGKQRPDNSEFNSMPSGHTTFAFVNATVLYNKFNDTSPLLAYSGYGFASTTAVFRVLNNKHYISDVLVGAGIGMLVTSLVYYFEPLKNFNPFKKSQHITLIPQIDNNRYGVYFAYEF